MYTYAPPRHDLSDECAVAIRASLTRRTDIRAAYWLTTLYDTDKGIVPQDELHIELVQPPEEAATPEQYRELAGTIRLPVGHSLSWVISNQETLNEIRTIGVRVI